MKTFLKFFCGILTVFILSACQKKEAPKPIAEPLTVSAVKIIKKDIPLSFEYTGKSQGFQETEVRARVGGILMKRNYVEGSKVEEGQILFEIDRKPYKIAMQKASANLAKQAADLKAAEKQLSRVKTLSEKGFASTRSLDEAEARVLSIRASIASAKAAYEEAKLNYDYTLVTAPIAGLTGTQTHSEGSLISTTGENSLLTTITQTDPIYVVFSVADNALFRLGEMIKQGLISNPRGNDELKAKVIFSDNSVFSQDGIINFINPTVDQETGTLKLRAVFDNPDHQIVPGQFLRVSLEGLTRLNAVSLPKHVVMQGADGSFVYVLDKGKVAVRSVTTGYTAKSGEWIIDDGLQEGDTVITDNFVKIKAGISVNVQYTVEKTSI